MTHERILVVENETITAMEVCELLEELGYEPLGPVSSGEEAIAKVGDLRPDAVLMDIVLDGRMDGIQAAEIIQTTYHCPVVYLTAHSDQGTLDRAKLTNPFGYITKPFSERELHVGIDVALYRHRMEAQMRETEETLKESEERYRTAIESCNDGVVIVKGDEKVYVNRRFLEMFGYEGPEEVLGRGHFVHVHPDDRERVMETNRRRQKGEPVPSRYEFKGIRKDGTILNVEVTVTEISYQGAPGSLAYLRDITERKRAEELFEELFQSLPIAAYVYVEWQLVMVNEHQESLTGYTRSDLQELSSTLALVHEDDRERVRTTAIEMLKGKRQSPYEYRMVTKQGQIRWVMESITSIEYSAKRAVLVIFMDITERKLLESQLVQAQKLESIGQLAAGIAHEINTPTQYIWDNTLFLQKAFGHLVYIIERYRQLLAEGKNKDADQLIGEAEAECASHRIDYFIQEAPTAIEQTLEGVDRVAGIVGAMRDFSHPGSEEKTLGDINRAIESTVTIARNEWKHVADVVMDLDRSLPPVPCFPGEFNQAILNIVINAIHAIADVVENGACAKGTITVTTRQTGDWAEVRIGDTGNGIPENIRSRIFDPFFTTKEVGKGTGQGLSITHGVIVEQHRGTIRFETEIGKGTTFIIGLPLQYGVMDGGLPCSAAS